MNTESVKKAVPASKRGITVTRDQPAWINNHSLHVTKGPLNSENAVELQCDEIQGKLSTFISSLKNAQENILKSDTKEHDSRTKEKQWCTVRVGNPGKQKLRRVGTPTQEQLEKERKKMALALRDIVGLTSRELYSSYLYNANV